MKRLVFAVFVLTLASCLQAKSHKAVVVKTDYVEKYADLKLLTGDKGVVYWNGEFTFQKGDTLAGIRFDEHREVKQGE